MSFRILLSACAVGLLATSAGAVSIKIDVANLSPAGGVSLTPFFVAAHDGSFDAFDAGSGASAGVTTMAELGDTSGITSEATAAQATAATATIFSTGGGPLTPGSAGSVVLNLDPSIHRYLTYGAMAIPSNDAFFGNDSPTQIELFDAGGNYVAAGFTLTGASLWDAGTEDNQLTGAAFVVGQDATAGDDQLSVVQPADLSSVFDPVLGQDTPPGFTFSVAPTAGQSIAGVSFSLVPEPTTLLLMATGMVAIGATRRRVV